jgi:hypothetical protein
MARDLELFAARQGGEHLPHFGDKVGRRWNVESEVTPRFGLRQPGAAALLVIKRAWLVEWMQFTVLGPAGRAGPAGQIRAPDPPRAGVFR